MSPLVLLWTVSLVISVLALLIMTGLVGARLATTRALIGRQIERRRLIPVLLGGQPPVAGSNGEGSRLLADLSIELIRLVRGSDRERFAETASRLGVPDRLRQRLSNRSPRVRLVAVDALAEFGDESSVRQLHAALRDRNSDVRLTAALALATIGRSPPAGDLVRLLGLGTSEQSLLIRSLFCDIVRHDPEGLKAAIQAGEIPPTALVGAIHALSGSGDYSLIPLIVGLAENAPPDGPVLSACLRALGKLGHPAAAGVIERAIASPCSRVRAEACQAAGQIGLRSAAAALVDRLGDPDFDVRLSAGEALLRMGDEGIARLRELAIVGWEPARSAAASILAERGAK